MYKSTLLTLQFSVPTLGYLHLVLEVPDHGSGHKKAREKSESLN